MGFYLLITFDCVKVRSFTHIFVYTTIVLKIYSYGYNIIVSGKRER